jgi:hypothetical protein
MTTWKKSTITWTAIMTDESPSLSSNACLMKDVTVLICSSVDGLSIFLSFSSSFNSRKFEYIFWKYWYKMFRLLVFLLHSKKKRNSSSKTLQIVWKTVEQIKQLTMGNVKHYIHNKTMTNNTE